MAIPVASKTLPGTVRKTAPPFYDVLRFAQNHRSDARWMAMIWGAFFNPVLCSENMQEVLLRTSPDSSIIP